MMKIVNTEEKHLHIFPTTWEISMKFSGKICLMIISSHKKQGFAPSIENTVLQKPKRVGSNWPFCILSQIDIANSLLLIKNSRTS